MKRIRWDDPVVRTFLITSKRTQIMELMVGLAWLIISIITVLFIKRYLKKTLKTE
jgi:hypothetical protein